ncbi:penicillin acylase family protein [Sandarakinorhabdus glacialis]|nr:penicillin acylase family protein [Polymorphobacter glacialis]
MRSTLTAAAVLTLFAAPALAGPATESRRLPGLAAPAEIIVDRWGISHVYAANTPDAFFLQGYAAARDRLWQIDLWRKRGLGRLAASFGPTFVEQDRASRLFLYRGDMAAEWASYPAEAQAWTTAFAAGINAFITDTEGSRQPLPPEFTATASRPERWTADDIVRIRSNALAANIPAEVARAQSLCAGGLPYEPLRRKLEPAHQIIVPKGVDPCIVTPDILKTYNLAIAGVSFDKGTVVAIADSDGANPDDDTREGSNNWVIAPGRSTTGRAILANDPHRAHGIPGLRYLIHLDAPDLKIAGAGEPALPGISFGHNEDMAWGLTIFAMDQQDLIVSKPGEPVTAITETIDVKDQKPRAAELLFTRDGPVIAVNAAGNRFAVRATWDRPGASAYFSAAWLFRAKNWTDFTAARAHWGAPPLNLVYADTKGDIGWAAAGFAPVRTDADGLSPVAPGSKWHGLLDPSLLPSLKNPAKGWFASANEMNLPAGYPSETRRIAYEWADRSRIDRIDKIIGSKPRFSLEDSMALQNDEHSTLALRAVALLRGLNSQDRDEAAAIALLQGWDGHLTADSPAAALYEVWLARHLGTAAVAALVPAATRPAFARPESAAVISVLEQPGTNAAPILKTSLAAAWGETRTLLGPDPKKWQWGNLHAAHFTPALALPGRAADQAAGPLPLGGSGSTPKAASHRGATDNFNVAAGASVRMVLDVGAWDNSRVINTPGQSGNVDSPHYRDLFPLWADGRYVPMLWTKAAILREAETIIKLTPAS